MQLKFSRVVTCLLAGVAIAASAWPPVRAPAQERPAAQPQGAGDFAGVYQRWQQAQDPEQKIALGEEALALERTLADWPLQAPRGRVRGDLGSTLGDAYATRSQGDGAENLEKSIAHYAAALAAFPRAEVPQDWAQTQNRLGLAYYRRVRGERAENIERAIAAHQEALTVFTREAFPQDWALTQNVLGLVYGDRLQGSRADNLEKGIAHYEAALAVYTRDAFPESWARVQSGLGLAFTNRIKGERADNLEKAIAHYEAAVAGYTREAFPREWAQAQNSLGFAFSGRLRGDRADNLEKAIAAYQQALTVSTREAFPQDWATTRHNLGSVYASRIRGDPADNLEQAIAHLDAALAVRTREAYPQEWASTQGTLGSVYFRRVLGERGDNVDYAIAALDAALTVLTREAFPQEWAMAQNLLGLAHWGRERGDPAENLEKAIAASEATLTLWTREAEPQGWAVIQTVLGFAYANRTRGERPANLAKAVDHLEAALTVHTREAFPRDHLRAARMLGNAFSEAKDWQRAGAAYGRAREAFLLLFGQGLGQAESRALISDAGSLFAEAAFAAAQHGEAEQALALASEGKARQMAVALKLQTLDLAPDRRRRLDELRTAIGAKERIVLVSEGAARASAIDELVALRTEVLDIIKAETGGRAAPGIALAQARSLVAGGGAVVAPILTKAGTKILIVTAKGGAASISVLDLPDLTTDKLDALMRGERIGALGGWLGAYNINYIEDEAELLKRWPEWTRAIEDAGPAIWRLGAGRLHAALNERGVKRGSRLIWLPAGALGILPVGLAQDPVSKRRFVDDYEIVYAPSLEALATAQSRLAKPAKPTLAAIINPTGDLPGTEKEGAVAASYFPGNARTLLETKAATVEAVLGALKGRTHWHFASHGVFSWDEAALSALVVHGDERLTVARLAETDGLGRPRLVVLSACETGLYDIDRNPDEFVGLPGAFAALGAVGVLGTLWPVPDEVTALLMARFYELHMGSGLAPPTALVRAQAWLRGATIDALAGYAKVAVAHGRLQPRHLAEIERSLGADGLARPRIRGLVLGVAHDPAPLFNKEKAGVPKGASKSAARPYAHPYFWAGFIHTGL